MKDCPARLYKYRDLAGSGLGFVERIILHDEIYLPSPTSFNDPFDCMPDFDMRSSLEDRIEMFKRALSRREPNLSETAREERARQVATNPVFELESEEARLTMQTLHDQQIRTLIGVYCVSERPDSLLMWSHYAGSHSGICLEFDSDAIPFDMAQEVIYKEDRTPISRSTETDEESMVKALLTKSADWEHEKEWRVIEHEHGPGIYKIPANALTGVILGARISYDHEKQIRQWLSARSSGIPAYRSIASDSQFRVRIEPLSKT